MAQFTASKLAAEETHGRTIAGLRKFFRIRQIRKSALSNELGETNNEIIQKLRLIGANCTYRH